MPGKPGKFEMARGTKHLTAGRAAHALLFNWFEASICRVSDHLLYKYAVTSRKKRNSGHVATSNASLDL